MSYTPAIITILDEVEARFGNISVTNGYVHEFKKVERAKMEPFKGYDLPAINYYLGRTSSERDNYGSWLHSTNLIVEAHHKTRDDPFTDIASSLDSDIAICLFRATLKPKVTDTVDICLGGLVEDLKYDGFSPFINVGEKPFCGARIELTIVSSTNIGEM